LAPAMTQGLRKHE